MSAPPPDRPRSRTPPPQQQSSAIRVVPYSPEHQGLEASSGDIHPKSGTQINSPDIGTEERKRSNQASENTSGGWSTQGSVPSSSPTPPFLVPKQDHGVSGSSAPTRGRLSASSYTTHTSQSRRYSASSHFSDAEPSSSSGPEPEPGKRRTSRRRNFVAVLNEDKKTFSLVRAKPEPEPESQAEPQPEPQPEVQPEPQPEPQPQPSQLPRSSSALSDESGLSADFRSPHYPSFVTTPRVSQSSSHEGYTSYASSQYDRPGSALTATTATIPDRSITPNTPAPSSPGSSTIHDNLTEYPIGEFASSPWNYRLKGPLRKVPEFSDLKGDQPGDSPTSDTTEIPLPPVPESTSPYDSDDNWRRHPTDEEKASVHSNTPSTGSDNPNYITYGRGSEAPSEAGFPAAGAGEEEGGFDDSQLAPGLRPQASFNSQRSASTGFDTTNVHVYGHSSSEESAEALPQQPAEDAPALHPQSSFQSDRSGVSASSEATNYRVYAPSSPGLPPVPETETLQNPHELRPEQSFLSVASTTSDAANYKVYGPSSPAGLESVESFNPPSESGSYAPLIGPAGAAISLFAQHEEAGPSGTAHTEPNYVVYDEPSRDPSFNESPDPSPPGSAIRNPRRDFSDDSLVIPPLRPKKSKSQEGLGYYRSRSRSTENLRAKKSGKSLNSISSIINEETVEYFHAGQAFLDEPAGQFEPTGPFDPCSVAGPSERQRQLDIRRQREQQLREAAAWAEDTEAPPPMTLPTTPHQWSSQLSTVMSETEPGSSGGGSRQGSLASVSLPGSHGGSHGRRSSRCWSSHSRQMLSISSSLAGELENISHSRSNSDPIDRPSPTLNPRAYQLTVRDHDEHGDGLADLQQITPRPSRQRLSDLYSSSNSSERNLHSSQSSRSRSSSFGASAIPTWARLYYGSGERKFFRSASISSLSDMASNRPQSTQHSGSPTADNFPSHIYSPRRRPRTGEPSSAFQRRSTAGSMDIEQSPTQDDMGIRRGIRRITSSLWSPHLRRDIRARDRYSIWDPPSVAWSAESGMFGRRNLQVVLFVVGFIFPFAWMIGAVLPLPKPSPLAMLDRYSSISDLGVHSREHEFERHIESVDELRYQNAKWWRALNRGMSFIGLLIIGAVIGLAVAAVKKGWVKG